MSAISLERSTLLPAGLEGLSREDLLALWLKAYGTRPFKGARRGTLLRGVSYARQAKTHGGLKAATNRKLLALAKEMTPAQKDEGEGDTSQLPKKAMSSVTKTTALPKLQLGSQLAREWNGKTYKVHCTDQGFVLNGVAYGSLSSVARAITGTHWSGPRFFGVRA